MKVPAAIKDVQESTKCIAFELPSAAAFHLHRANEATLAAYFDVVSGGAKPPRQKTMGAYLKRMRDLGVGHAKVLAALDQLRDLHRNPVMHPQDFLKDTDEAISLMGAIRAAMTEMLKVIPVSQSYLLGGPAP